MTIWNCKMKSYSTIVRAIIWEEKMRDIDSIIMKYRRGDFEERLNLFLEYRTLRSDFVQIDQDEASAEGAHTPQPVLTLDRRRKSVFYPFMRLLKRCHSCFL